MKPDEQAALLASAAFQKELERRSWPHRLDGRRYDASCCPFRRLPVRFFVSAAVLDTLRILGQASNIIRRIR